MGKFAEDWLETFLPLHMNCGSAIGGKEFSVERIRQKFDNEEYPLICMRCHEGIVDFEDIDIQVFYND